jgi:hypothetical protein
MSCYLGTDNLSPLVRVRAGIGIRFRFRVRDTVLSIVLYINMHAGCYTSNYSVINNTVCLRNFKFWIVLCSILLFLFLYYGIDY